jgi:hypothetical protein
MMFRRIQIGVIAVVTMLAVSACGGGTNDAASEPELASIEDTGVTSEPNEETSVTTTTPDVDPEEAFARFEACMADYGVTISAGIGGGGAPVPADDPDDLSSEPVTPEKVEEAQRECQSILDEAFGSFDLDPEQEAEMADRMLALQLCLADEGFDIDLSGNSFSIDQSQIDMAELDAAMYRCSQEAGLGPVAGSGS